MVWSPLLSISEPKPSICIGTLPYPNTPFSPTTVTFSLIVTLFLRMYPYLKIGSKCKVFPTQTKLTPPHSTTPQGRVYPSPTSYHLPSTLLLYGLPISFCCHYSTIQSQTTPHQTIAEGGWARNLYNPIHIQYNSQNCTDAQYARI